MSMHSLSAPTSAPAAKAFYAIMSAIALAVAFLGFVPTYLAPLAQGRFSAPGIVHVHGILFFGWTIFFCAQSYLIYAGRVLAHREWGLFGVSLATAMTFSVLMATAAMVHVRTQAGFRDEALAFAWVQIGGMLMFGGMIAAAIANIGRPEVHKRLMLLATIFLLDAPIARWVIGFSGAVPVPGAPPPMAPVFTASILADLLIVVALVFDWRTRGKPHVVYWIAAAVIVAFQATRQSIAESQTWLTIASWIFSLGG